MISEILIMHSMNNINYPKHHFHMMYHKTFAKYQHKLQGLKTYRTKYNLSLLTSQNYIKHVNFLNEQIYHQSKFGPSLSLSANCGYIWYFLVNYIQCYNVFCQFIQYKNGLNSTLLNIYFLIIFLFYFTCFTCSSPLFFLKLHPHFKQKINLNKFMIVTKGD